MLTKLENNYYKEQFLYKESYNLDFFPERDIKFVNGVKYFINSMNRSEGEYKDWLVITGEFLNTIENKCFNYSLAITPYEYEDILNSK